MSQSPSSWRDIRSGGLRAAVRCVLLWLVVTTVLVLSSAVPATAADTLISGLRIGEAHGRTRIVLDLDANVPIDASLSTDHQRLDVVVPQARWALPLGKLPRALGLATAWYTSTSPGAASLTVDLNSTVRIAHNELLVPSVDSQFYRLVIDLAASAPPRSAPLDLPQVVASEGAPAPPEPKPLVQPQPASPSRVIASAASVLKPPPTLEPTAPVPAPAPRPARPLIVLDPGHGGKDPGTIGRSGVFEKNVTLAVAKAVAARLKKTGRYRVVLTRDQDVFVRLRQRLNAARAAGGNLFLSIHADSLTRDATMRGASVYTLSDRASDREAASLARKENKADIVSGLDLTDQDPVVSEILIDLALRDATNHSIGFADYLVQELAKVTRMVQRTRRFAGFVVLKSPDMPSVLLELGFLSNKRDERLLTEPAHQRKLAGAVLDALDDYFEDGHG